MQLIVILTCRIAKLSFYEDYFMKIHNSKSPHGYNLRDAGNCGKLSEETKRLMSESRQGEKHPMYGKHHTQDTRDAISNALINLTIRTGHLEQNLPKYIKWINWQDRKGYAIVSHPKCKIKYFTSQNLSLLDNFDRCLNYLETLK